MNAKSIQGQQEYRSGYLHGLSGGDKPGREKGAAFYGGYLCGKAEREERQERMEKVRQAGNVRT